MRKSKKSSAATATGQPSTQSLLAKAMQQQSQPQVPLDKQNRMLVALAQSPPPSTLNPNTQEPPEGA